VFTQDPNTPISDGQLTFVEGQDASKSHYEVSQQAYFLGVNVTTKTGSLSPRWGVKQHTLVFKNIQDEELFKKGKFQAGFSFKANNTSYLLCILSGNLFYVDTNTFEVDLIPDITVNPIADRVNWSYADKYLVIFDFPDYPVLIESTSARRANKDDLEVPISVLGSLTQNRLGIANAGSEFTFGDPTGSLAAPDAPISFLEVQQLASPYFGQIFKLPTNYQNEPITAMGFLQLTDTSTGIGPTIVATRNAVFAYQTNQPRAAWEASQFGAIVVPNAGIAGQRAQVNVNDDLFFLSNEGDLRSLSMSRDEQNKWARVPLSDEVSNILKFDKDLIKLASLTYYKNKVFVTTNPYAVVLENGRLDYVHEGFAVFEFDNVSKFLVDSKPVWAGLWTGINPTDSCVVDDKMFIFGKDGGENVIYSYDTSCSFDYTRGQKKPIISEVETKELTFQDEFSDKELHSLDLNLHDVVDRVTIDIFYKYNYTNIYKKWASFTRYLKKAFCYNPSNYVKMNFPELSTGAPDETCEETFRSLRLRFKITGYGWRLRSYKVNALKASQSENYDSCDFSEEQEIEQEQCETVKEC
jgi:hypothetical protein